MKTSVPNLITIWLTITFSVLMMENTFSQTDRGNGIEVTGDKDDHTADYVTGLTPARARSLVGGIAGLISLIIGWRVKKRSPLNRGSGMWVGLVLGLVAIILSVVHLVNVTGGFGTGGGKAGAIVALMLGLIGASLSGMAFHTKRNN